MTRSQSDRSAATADQLLPDTPLVVNDADESAGSLHFQDLWNFRELLFFLTWRDIKIKYKQTFMGAAWAVIQPLLMMLVFAVFFGAFIGVPSDGLPHLLFFYCGLLPWTFFSNAVNTGSTSLLSNSHLITKIYFPRLLIPTATVGSGLVDLLIASVILLGLCLFYRTPLNRGLLITPLLFLLIFLLALGLSLLTAALTAKYRDVRHVLPLIIQVWFFVTPIIYPAQIVPERWRWIIYLNPVAGIVSGIRDAIAGRALHWESISLAAVMTALIFGVSLHLFTRLEKSLVDSL